MNKTDIHSKKFPALLIWVLLLALSLFIMGGFYNNWGNVTVRRNLMPSENGLQYSYLSFLQNDVSDDNPGPAVLIFHGNNDNAQSFSGWAVELIRRGYNVFILDVGDSGLSDSGFSDDNATVKEFTQFVQDLSFIDGTRVAVTGHSKGASYSAYLVDQLDLAGGIGSAGMRAAKTWGDSFEGNMVTIIGHGDWMNRLDNMEKINMQFMEIMYGPEYTGGKYPESGSQFGSVEENNYRAFESFDGIFSQHAAARWNPWVVNRVCKYMEILVPTGTALAPEDQIMIPFFLISLLGMISFVGVLVCLALELSKLPALSSVNRNIPAWRGRTGKRWAYSALLSLVPILPFFIGISYFSEQYLHMSKTSALLPVSTTNRFILYFIAIGIYECLLFFFTFYRKENASFAELGLAWEESGKDNLRNLGKSLALAALAAAIGLTFLYVLEVAFGMSFTCFYLNIRAVTWTRVFKSLAYIPIFLILFIGMQFGSNISRRLKPTGHEMKDMVRDIVVNCLVGTGLLTLYFFINMWCNDHNIIWAVVDDIGHSYYMYNFIFIGNAVTATNTVLYRKTGTIWPGAFFCAILFGILIPGGSPIV